MVRGFPSRSPSTCKQLQIICLQTSKRTTWHLAYTIMRSPSQILLSIGIASLSRVILNNVHSLSTDNFSRTRWSLSATKVGVTRNDYVSPPDRVKALRRMLESDELTVMPCCYDGLTARLVEQAGFNLTFMTGFGVSSTYGLPDTGLISFEEMVQSASVISNSLRSIPCIGDGDTGYGNPMNVKRTVAKYCQAGMAGIMVEDQVAPKRCGHTVGKSVVDRDEAYRRIKAAVDARNEGSDIVILARTDSRASLGLDEAIERCKMFRKLGADWTFLEAPQSEEEMIRYCAEVDGPKLANMLEGGKTPVLSPERLKEIGYSVAAYPLTLLSASVKAMQSSLQLLKSGQPTDSMIVPFTELQDVVGFTEYNAEADRYKS